WFLWLEFSPRNEASRICALRPSAFRGVCAEKLEIEFQRQLQLARAADCAGDKSIVAGSEVRVGAIEMRMVKGVEGFSAELQPHAFADHAQGELLEKRHGDVSRSRRSDAAKCSCGSPESIVGSLRERVRISEVVDPGIRVGGVLR